jgi:hypothetical protein
LLNDHRLGRKGPNMMIIGVDYHPSFQTIAFFAEETGEYDERRLTTVMEKQNVFIGTCTFAAT